MYDSVIIGGGPAGLAAAINLASEGIKVLLIDSKEKIGGQAAQSSRIENYPGFPGGISGQDLTNLFKKQALDFGVEIVHSTVATYFRKYDNCIELSTNSEKMSRIRTKSLILALGLSYRKLQASGADFFIGRGVYYGETPLNKKNVCIVGGGNSAGQACLHLTANGAKVNLIIRAASFEAGGMSHYLSERIIKDPNIEVYFNCEVEQVFAENVIESIQVRSGDVLDSRDPIFNLQCDALSVFIGASPKTHWLQGLIDLNEKGYILTSDGFKTSMERVFVCGDVREGSIKRVASAVGEGTVVCQQVKSFLRSLEG